MKSISVTFLPLFLGIVVFIADPTTQQAPTFECGRSRFTSRTAGGGETSPGEFPWMAHIQTGQNVNVCGGTLISDRHVLTAAHCLQNNPDGDLSWNRFVSITLGAHDVNSNIYGSQQKFDWKRIVLPMNWTLENDIAIITLSRPVNFTDFVQPACLPSGDNWNGVNNNVVLTGWGMYDSSNSLSSVLRRTDTTVISSDGRCQQTAGVGDFSGVNVICSDGSQGRRFYYGDDGGPMNYYNPECSRWFVLGVAGRGDSFNVGNGRPNVFTRVSAHLDFIRSHTGVASSTDCLPTTYLPTTEATTAETTIRQLFSCAGKPDGNYPNPASACSTTFYMCSNGIAYLFTCASGLVFRKEINVCDWPSNVAGCY